MLMVYSGDLLVCSAGLQCAGLQWWAVLTPVLGCAGLICAGLHTCAIGLCWFDFCWAVL
ncbi:hypothetical protein U1Q18_035221, partial [Sarracenia purpurea var. burkii]